jgi:hypothetical protein
MGPIFVIGRIFLSPSAPEDRPWMWTSGHSADSMHRAALGYEPTREAAMVALSTLAARTVISGLSGSAVGTGAVFRFSEDERLGQGQTAVSAVLWRLRRRIRRGTVPLPPRTPSEAVNHSGAAKPRIRGDAVYCNPLLGVISMKFETLKFDEPVFCQGVGMISFGTAIRMINDGSAPIGPGFALFRDGEPSILTLVDIDRMAASPDFAAWKAANPRS